MTEEQLQVQGVENRIKDCSTRNEEREREDDWEWQRRGGEGEEEWKGEEGVSHIGGEILVYKANITTASCERRNRRE